MRETGGLETASTITLALQANRLTKCASLLVISSVFTNIARLVKAWPLIFRITKLHFEFAELKNQTLELPRNLKSPPTPIKKKKFE